MRFQRLESRNEFFWSRCLRWGREIGLANPPWEMRRRCHQRFGSYWPSNDEIKIRENQAAAMGDEERLTSTGEGWRPNHHPNRSGRLAVRLWHTDLTRCVESRNWHAGLGRNRMGAGRIFRRERRGATSAEIQQQYPTVRMVGLATRRVRFEDWKSGSKVLDLSYQMRPHQVSSDEIALGVHIGIDSVTDPKLSHQDFNRHVMGGRDRPNGAAIYLVICFPDSEVMAAGHYCGRIGQGI